LLARHTDILESPVVTSQEQPFDETDFAPHGNDNSSNERPPSVLSVIRSLINDGESGLSGSRPTSFAEIPYTSITINGPSTQGVSDGSGGGLPSVPSGTPSLIEGGEPRLSGTRPPSFEENPQPSIPAGGPPTQDANEARPVPSGSHRDVYDAYAGRRAVRHHNINLLQTYKYPEDSKPKPKPEPEPEPKSKPEPEPKPDSDQKRYMQVSFAELQRMRLRKLQIKLVRHAVRMRYSNKESEGWEETLQQYSNVPVFPSTGFE
jgi:hypothetical protein